MCPCIIIIIISATPRHFAKRGICANRGQQPFHPHTCRSATEEAGRGPETYREARFEYILGPHEFLVYQSVTYPDSYIHGQVTETRRIWTWRRRALSIFSRDYLRWTEESPAPPQSSKEPSKAPAESQHLHRWLPMFACILHRIDYFPCSRAR